MWVELRYSIFVFVFVVLIHIAPTIYKTHFLFTEKRFLGYVFCEKVNVGITFLIACVVLILTLVDKIMVNKNIIL